MGGGERKTPHEKMHVCHNNDIESFCFFLEKKEEKLTVLNLLLSSFEYNQLKKHEVASKKKPYILMRVIHE